MEWRSTIHLSAATIREIPSRWQLSVSTVIGFAGVSLIISALLALRSGVNSLFVESATSDVIVVVAEGAKLESMSEVSPRLLAEVSDRLGLAVSGEVVANAVELPSGDPNRPGKIVVGRGLDQIYQEIRPNWKVIAGRSFKSGQYEVTVGQKVAKQYPQLRIGSFVRIGNKQLLVVGIFADLGGSAEGEIWLDRRVYQTLMSPPASPGAWTSFSTLRVKTSASISQKTLHKLLDENERMTGHPLAAVSEKEFLYRQGEELLNLVYGAIAVYGAFLGAGAVFAAVNTMYAVVGQRKRDIATLRALGFGKGSICASILAEASILSITGALIGIVGATMFLRNFSLSIFNEASNSDVSIAAVFDVPQALLAFGFALLLGALGSVLPCVRAIRVPISEGLRS